ncbi:MAG: right-handed parallel beta-helix repeat-containing protein [Solirubrobacteraceae bacterium]
MRRLPAVAVFVATVATMALSPALAHEERPAQYPPGTPGAKVPAYRTSGKALVVCTKATRATVRKKLHGKVQRRNKALLKRCRYHQIMDAVMHARSGYRILVMPGRYTESHSRAVPVDDPKCKNDYTPASDGHEVPTFQYQLSCPRSKNLITIAGDRNGDRRCDTLCNLQIEGTGAKPSQVTVVGDKTKQNAIRADRADGFYLTNMKVLYGDINSVYVMETDGFVLKNLITAQARRYGVLTFTSDHGLYDHIDAYGNGDSGVYPGSGSPGGDNCERYGIELHNIDSHDNTLGYSGTAGDNVWVHDSKFRDNATGLATDSFASGHPGMPQHCAKWENNQIYSNNADLFNAKRIQYCHDTPYPKRDLSTTCPTFQVPVGTGAIIAGGNKDIVQNNRIYDNWRDGVKLLWVPAQFRGENDPAKARDTSYDNKFLNNKMGVAPNGAKAPNGNDYWWDGEGSGTCFDGNTGADGGPATHKSPTFPACPGSSVYMPGDASMTASQASCATWDPDSNPFPAGCDWFSQPPKPQS